MIAQSINFIFHSLKTHHVENLQHNYIGKISYNLLKFEHHKILIWRGLRPNWINHNDILNLWTKTFTIFNWGKSGEKNQPVTLKIQLPVHQCNKVIFRKNMHDL